MITVCEHKIGNFYIIRITFPTDTLFTVANYPNQEKVQLDLFYNKLEDVQIGEEAKARVGAAGVEESPNAV